MQFHECVLHDPFLHILHSHYPHMFGGRILINMQTREDGNFGCGGVNKRVAEEIQQRNKKEDCESKEVAGTVWQKCRDLDLPTPRERRSAIRSSRCFGLSRVSGPSISRKNPSMASCCFSCVLRLSIQPPLRFSSSLNSWNTAIKRGWQGHNFK